MTLVALLLAFKAPSGDALHGLAAMYAEVVQPDAKLRTRFLSSLLKPFDEASCLVGPGAAIADVHALAFCAYAAAALPCKRGDEPLTLLHAINGVVSRHGHDVLDRLRKGLRAAGLGRRLADADDASGDEDAGAAAAGGDGVQVDGAAVNGAAVNGAANGGGVAGHLSGPLRASLALSMLLVLKQWLVAAYGLSNERVAAFELKGERRRAEEKAMVARSAKVPEFGLAVVNLRVLEDATGALLVEQYKVVSGLMDNDAANYRQAAVSAQLNGMDGGDDGTADAHHAATPAAGLVVFQTAKKPPRTGASTGRGKRGRSTAGKAASSSKHGSTAKRKHVARRVQMSDEDSEQDGED